MADDEESGRNVTIFIKFPVRRTRDKKNKNKNKTLFPNLVLEISFLK